MKKVLLITDVNFWELSSGNRARINTLVSYLAEHVDLTVVNTGPANLEHSIFGCKLPFEFHILEKHKYLSSAGYGRRLKSFLKDRRFDTIIIEYIHSTYFLNYLKHDTTVILDAHDIVSERTKEFKKFKYGGVLYELTPKFERTLLSVYDYVMLLCQKDVNKLLSMKGVGKALLCPHPLNIVAHPIRKLVINITFIGSAYIPNVDAITWFLTKCWSKIASNYPVSLQIYGTVCNSIDSAGFSNVRLNGFNHHLNEIYDSADIVINPVRFGAGLKIKNIEALAHGRPLVTTLHGSRGIETATDKAFLIGTTPNDFVKKIESLIVDYRLREKLSSAAYQFIEQHYSPDTCFKLLMYKIGGK